MADGLRASRRELENIFRPALRGPAPSDHDTQACQRHLEMIVSYLNDHEKQLCPSTADILLKVNNKESRQHVEWFPDYGCALLATRGASSRTHLMLLALDDWSFDPATEAGRQTMYSAEARGYTPMDCGAIHTRMYHVLLRLIPTVIEKCKEQKKGDRPPKVPKMPSFIRAVVRSSLDLIDQMEEGVLAEHSQDGLTTFLRGEVVQFFDHMGHKKPTGEGGFTDVGQHTGCDPRATSWPLAMAIFHAVLMDSPDAANASEMNRLFRFAHLGMLLTLAESHVQGMDKADPDSINMAMEMLKSVGGLASALSNDGHDLCAVDKRSKAVRTQLEALAKVQSDALRAKYAIPASVETAELAQALVPPLLSLPDNCERSGDAARDLALAKARARVNLDSIPFLNGVEAHSFATMEAWLKESSNKDPKSLPALIFLHTTESFMYSKVDELAAGITVTGTESQIEYITDTYRAGLHEFMATVAARSLMKVQLQSKEMLVVWISFCLIHKACKAVHPITDQYDIPLDAADLRHLVLSDRRAIEAAKKLHLYICRHQGGSRRGPTFSLQDEKPTWDLGREFGSIDAKLQDIWEQEQLDAQRRKDERWNEVVQKQRRAAQLRPIIQDEKAELSHENGKLQRLQADAEAASRAYHDAPSWNADYKRKVMKKAQSETDEQSNKVNRIRSSLRQHESELKDALEPPPPLFQPLPETKDEAMPVLFFLYMPSHFRSLSRMSCTAQQQLVPRSRGKEEQEAAKEDQKKVKKAITVKLEHSSWREYYNSYSDRSPEAENAVSLHQAFDQPEEVGPSSVDEYYSPDQGVWHPPGKQAQGWRGGPFHIDQRECGCYFNPFAPLPEGVTVRYFTEDLPEASNCMQWAMPQHGAATSTDRGNLALSKQNERPDFLDKPSFLTFGSLRSYPHRQFRSLCGALRDATLPLDHPACQLLVKMLLYHIGDIQPSVDSTQHPSLRWKTDQFEEDADGLVVLHEELHRLHEQMDQAPNQRQALQLLAEIASYASQWNHETSAVARGFAQTATRWAADLDCQIELAEMKQEWQNVMELRDLQAIFYMCSIICFSFHQPETDDARHLCMVIVQIKNILFFENQTTLSPDVSVLLVQCHDVVAARAEWMLAAIEGRHELLTDAVKLVLHDTPNDLEWTTLEYGCYETVSADGHLYSINVLTGTVLRDGVPPGRLPNDMLDHKLYQRTFGQRNFEIFAKGPILQTQRPVFGRLYEFELRGHNLIATEVGPDGTRLELWDATGVSVPDDRTDWGMIVPPRLKDLHSHWYCREAPAVYVRPIRFDKRDVHFVFTPDRSRVPVHGDFSFWQCHCVPLHRRRHVDAGVESEIESYQPLLDQCKEPNNEESFDTLMIQSSQASQFLDSGGGTLQTPSSTIAADELEETIRVISKFESIHFIHMLRNDHRQCVKLHLPRFNLTFEKRNGKRYWSSLDFLNFRLAETQQLEDCLLGWTQYLLLEKDSPHGVVQKIVVPHPGSSGHLQRNSSGTVEIVGDQGSGLEKDYHHFDVHCRLKNIQATSISARLLLAALHAATSTLLPERGTGMTGHECAIELVRQSWVNRPLNPNETAHLGMVEKFSTICPSLKLLCVELRYSSNKLAFLPHSSNPGTPPEGLVNDHCNVDVMNAKTFYQVQPPNNLRAQLTSGEQRYLWARAQQPPTFEPGRRTDLYGVHRTPEGPMSEADLENLETRLKLLVQTVTSNDGAGPADDFPLEQNDEASSALGNEMLSELRESHEAHLSVPAAVFAEGRNADATIVDCQRIVKSVRPNLEDHLLCSLNHMNPDSHSHGMAFRIYKTANLHPTATSRDLMRMATDPALISRFNPSLSKKACSDTYDNIILWLRLCVMEDKLDRLHSFCKSGDVAELLQELFVERIWDARDHPYWAVFEVEGQLQIRPRQYTVAKAIMDNPAGTIVQLNMGEGKTRVILPMLMLFWASKRDRIVRAHILPQLFHEAFEFFHQHLCGSVLGVKLVALPFCRDVDLDAEQIDLMIESMLDCQREGRIVLVTPASRLSLLLKWHELHTIEGNQEVCDKLIRLAGTRPVCDGNETLLRYCDILDESDEILSHRWQLIYAVGRHMKLPSIDSRIAALDGLLRVIKNGLTDTANSRLHSFLSDPEMVKVYVSDSTDPCPERFPRVELVDGHKLKTHMPHLVHELARSLFENPTHKLRWIKTAGSKDQLMSFVCDADYDPRMTPPLMQIFGNLSTQQLHDLLALRGFLAFGLLAHCLKKRHRVNFGVSRPQGKKRTAVPFRANDIPSERSEFAHPDCLLAYTFLAYYSDGLSQKEVKGAFRELLKTGPNAQREIYRSWYALSKESVAHVDRAKIDEVQKIDLQNAVQFSLLVRHFSQNTATISFWLSNCVLDVETMQYPHRLVANAWHVADNPTRELVGFSGTNDNYRILPKQVHQHFIKEDPHIHGTNGRMLSLALEKAQCVTLAARDKPEWEAVLQALVDNNCQALIDAGALMTGAAPAQIAKRWLTMQRDTRFKGAVYFDSREGMWMVRNRTDQVWPKSSSPIHEKDALVYFDEGRCRGADMKLPKEAMGLLTVGVGMIKDKFMQALGRMRKLEKGQTVQVVFPADVAQKILDHARKKTSHDSTKTIHMRDVLNWVMLNTVQATADGLQEWATQGIYFCETKGFPDRALQPEKLELEDMYSFGRKSLTLRAAHNQSVKSRRAICQGELNVGDYLRDIDSQMGKYGDDFEAQVGLLDQECERELEKEVELEEEVEREIPQVQPRQENDWAYEKALVASSAIALPAGAGVVRLDAALSIDNIRCQPSLQTVGWADSVYCTTNFWQSVQGNGLCNDYMRPVDAMLLFRSSRQVLLLSEREADFITQQAWFQNTQGAANLMVMLPYQRSFADGILERGSWRAPPFQLPAGASPTIGPSDAQMCSVQLFAGECMFDTPNRRESLHSELLVDQSAGKAAVELVHMRGLQKFLFHSHLDDAIQTIRSSASL